MSLMILVSLIVVVVIVLIVLLKPKKAIVKKTTTTKNSTAASASATPAVTSVANKESAALKPKEPLVTAAFNEENILQLQNFQLFRLEGNQQAALKVSTLAQSVPRPHPVVTILIRSGDNPDDIMELVNQDPEIAARILQTVNSAAFGLPQKITRLHQAVLLLGTRMVRDIALQIAVQENFMSSDQSLNKAIQSIWSSSFISSSIAYIVGKQLGLANTSELATQTLLIALGDVALLSSYPQIALHYLEQPSLFNQVNIAQQELSINSAIVGATLTKNWDLPNEIIDVIQDSLVPMAIPPAECQLANDHLRNVVFCYTLCRIGELVVRTNLQDINKFDLLKQKEIEFCYLAEYLVKTKLDSLLKLLHDPQVSGRINQVLQKLNNA